MISSILLLYATDAECIKKNLLQQLKGVPFECICLDDPKFKNYPALKKSSKSRLQIVFFSPGFLKFLECKHDEAYMSFRNLDPSTTIALFCCGLLECEVMCYHIAPLTSYSSWPRFEATQEGEKSGFAPYLIQLILEVFPTENLSSRNIVMVPELISKEQSEVYVIFPYIIPDLEDISVHIENNNNIHISPESVNPYVIQFQIPAMYVENYRMFSVQIHQSDTAIVEKMFRTVDDPVNHDSLPRKNSMLGSNSLYGILNKELQVLEDIGGISLDNLSNTSEERQSTLMPSEDQVNASIMEMCKKYGMGDLGLFVEESALRNHCFCIQSGIAEDGSLVLNCVCPERCASMSPEGEEELSALSRSQSLPSVLPEEDEFATYMSMSGSRECLTKSPTYDYLPMAPINDFLPTLPKEDYVSLSQNHYFSHRRRSSLSPTLEVNEGLSYSTYACMQRDFAKRIQRESFEELLELMQSCREGKTSLSEVERGFQLWRQRHTEMQRQDAEEMPKNSLYYTGRHKRNTSYVSDSGKSVSGSSANSRFSSSDSRKCSNTSSTSSKTSEASIVTLQSPEQVDLSMWYDYVSSDWLPAELMYPLDLDPDAPPLPTRPRPNSRPKIEMNMSSMSSVYGRRRVGTHMPPALNELHVREEELDSSANCSDAEIVESLLRSCEKYGLEELGQHFINEFSADKNDSRKPSLEVPQDEILLGKELRNLRGRSSTMDGQYSARPTNHDPDKHLSLHRSLSLPSTLFPNVLIKTEEKLPVNDQDSSEAGKCDNVVNSIYDRTYTPIMSTLDINDFSRNKNVPVGYLSKSQQELLELLETFKDGSITISQVEHQFQAWHERHVGASSLREKQLLPLKNKYEKAQKPNTFGIKKFILRKPKKSKESKMLGNVRSAKSVDNGRSPKTSVDHDKRLSKISYTSTSSGVSDNGDDFRNWFFNPGYDKTFPKYFCERSPGPPLPPRPPLTPIAVLRTCCTLDEDTDQSDSDKSPAKIKPYPPPKPLDHLQMMSNSTEVDEEENKDPNEQPESPYVIPNEYKRKKNSNQTKGNQTRRKSNLPCPVTMPHVCFKNNCITTFASMARSGVPRKKESAPTWSSYSKQAIVASPKLQMIPYPWIKLKKNEKIGKEENKEESMFYIPRRCSSVPDLQQGSEQNTQHIYLELRCDNRNIKTSDNITSKDKSEPLNLATKHLIPPSLPM